MYIRRKVFSSYVDEYGEERIFSTTEFIDSEEYLEERSYGAIKAANKAAKKAWEAGAADINWISKKGMRNAQLGQWRKANRGGSTLLDSSVAKKNLNANNPMVAHNRINARAELVKGNGGNYKHANKYINSYL